MNQEVVGDLSSSNLPTSLTEPDDPKIFSRTYSKDRDV